MTDRADGAWTPPILLTVATTGEGVAEVVAGIEAHRTHLDDSGELARRRLARTRREIEALALAEVRTRFAHLSGDARLDTLAAQVVAGESDPYAAADALVETL